MPPRWPAHPSMTGMQNFVFDSILLNETPPMNADFSLGISMADIPGLRSERSKSYRFRSSFFSSEKLT